MSFLEKENSWIDGVMIAAFWIIAIVALQRGFVYLTQRQAFMAEGYSQAELIKGLSQQWLKDAKMDNRIRILNVKLQKKSGELKAVEISLSADQKYSKAYEAELFDYLKRRAYQETGVEYRFLNQSSL